MTTFTFKGITATVGQIAQRMKGTLIDLEGGRINLAEVRDVLEEARLALLALDPDRVPVATASGREGSKWCVLCDTANLHGPYVGAGDGSGQRFAHPTCYEFERTCRVMGRNFSSTDILMLRRMQQIDDVVMELWLKTKAKPDTSTAVKVLRATLNTFSVEAINQSAVLIAARVWLRDYDNQTREQQAK